MQDNTKKLKVVTNSHDHAPVAFTREVAFSRTLGLVTQSELEILKNKTVAIAGLGGVGGSHVLTLVRLGIGGLHISDMDSYGVENFNRQAGANIHSVGRKKVDVMVEMALAVNPSLRIKTWPEGVHPSNAAEFFKGVDAYVDGLDFFAFGARQSAFRYCHENNIPATTVGPIGMGAALLNFLPGHMSFDEYFQWKETDTEFEKAVKFLMGLSPKVPHRNYIVAPEHVDLKSRKGPSTPMGCELAAGVAGTEVLKILLGRGKVQPAPHSIVFDAFHNRIFHKHLWFGNRNPWQKIKIALVKKMLDRK